MNITSMEVSVTRLGEILPFGNFLLGHFCNFHQNKQFQNIISCIYFNLQKQFDVTILNFDILATILATFPKIGQLFQYSGHSDGSKQF